MTCPKCNWNNDEQAHYCSNCAHQLIKPPPYFKRHPIKTAIGSLFIAFCLLFILGVANVINEVSEELDNETLEESIVSGSGDDTIALINLDGVIVESESSDTFSSLSSDTTSSREFKKTLKEIAQDESVKGVLLRINSPGGSAAASDEIFSEVKRFKNEYKMPVVAYFSDIAASGGYYVAMGADSIVANPGTLTGSIGVIISYVNLSELGEKYGVSEVVYKSGTYKDIGNPLRESTSEEDDIMQSVVDDTYISFVKAVSEGRKMDEEKVKTLADGRIYSAKQAKTNGLVDEIGNFEDAISLLKKRANVEDAKVIEFGTSGFFESLLGSTMQKFNFVQLPIFNHSTKLMYLYNPSL